MATHLDDLLASFQRHLRAAAKAPRTIELYSQSVRCFCTWLTAKNRPATLDELTRPAISAWLAELAGTCEPGTVRMRLRVMRRFCRWLVTEGELEKAPTEGIEIANSPDKPVPMLTDAEVAALLKTCELTPQPVGHRQPQRAAAQLDGHLAVVAQSLGQFTKEALDTTIVA
jgi:site-specific recombinase XerD